MSEDYEDDFIDDEADEYCYDLCYHWIDENRKVESYNGCYEDCIKNFWKR